MGQHDSKTKGVDFNEVAAGTEEFREVIGAMVAGLMTDGFTLDQARGAVAGFWASMVPRQENRDD